MLDVVRIVRRALALVPLRARRRIAAIMAVGVAVSALDLVGLLLLVPFLAFVGLSGEPSGAAVDIARSVLHPVGDSQLVLLLALGAVVVFVLKDAISVALLWTQTGVLFRAQHDLSRRILRAYVGASWLRQQDVDTGGLIRTATTASAGLTSVLTATIVIVSESATFIAVLVALVLVQPWLAVGAMVYLGTGGFLYLRILRRAIARRGVEYQTETRRMNKALVEVVGGIKELTVRDVTEAYAGRFDSANRGYLAAYRVMWVSSASMRYLLEMLMILGFAAVIGIAAATGDVSSALVAIGVLLAGGFRLIPSLNTVLSSVNNLRAYGPAVAVLEEELALPSGPPATATSDGGRLVPSGAFAFRDVGFRYPSRSESALAGVTIDVARGEAIGIVGATGSGKSTFVDLLLGLLEPDAGLIEIDGEPLRDHIHAWRSRIGFVPQDIFLADDTLAANISFGLPEAPDADRHLARAVSLAHLDDVVAMLPDGLGTVLGERGVRLSGGQRQRVGLARALYGDPSILILDEATSALDNETERSIGEALQSLHGQLTMVVIAHRLSTVRACDRIAFLEAGRVTGIGTFDELARDHAGFARLVELGSLGETG